MDPATIAYLIAAAIGALGTGAQLHSNKKIVEAQAEAQQQDRLRQAALQQESDAEVLRQIGSLAPEKLESDVDRATAARAAATVQPGAAPPPQYQAAPAAAPKEVVSDLDRRLGGAQSDARREAEARARLAAFSDASQQGNMDIARIGERLRRFQRESRGQSSILPWEMQAAADRGRGSQNVANIANLVSDIGLRYAMGRSAGSPSRAPAPDASAYAGWSNSPY